MKKWKMRILLLETGLRRRRSFFRTVMNELLCIFSVIYLV